VTQSPGFAGNVGAANGLEKQKEKTRESNALENNNNNNNSRQ
jgi:hypothetical protein